MDDFLAKPIQAASLWATIDQVVDGRPEGEQTRQDLLDPALGDRPVSAVGARWGFPDAAAFSRAFRAAYGLPPGEYRATQVGRTAPISAVADSYPMTYVASARSSAGAV